MRRFYPILFLCAAIVAFVLDIRSGRVIAHESMVVVAVPGLRRNVIDELIAAGELPVLAQHLRTALDATIVASPRSGTADFWRKVFTGDVRSALPSAEPPSSGGTRIAEHGFWQRIPESDVALVGIPGTEVDPAAVGGSVAIGGGSAVTGFLGGSEGRIFVWKRLVEGLFDWPYSSAAASASTIVAQLGEDSWSDWIPVALEEGRKGVFRLYRLGRNSVYATPIYAEAPVGGTAPRVLVDPSVVTVSDASGLAEVLFRQSRTFSETRALKVAELAAGDQRVVVYFETLVRFARQLDRSDGDGISQSLEREAYRVLDSRLARIVEAAGPSVLLVVLARDRTDEDHPAAWMIASNRKGSSVRTRLPLPIVAASLTYFAGGEDVSGFGGKFATTVRARLRPSWGHAPAELPLATEPLLPTPSEDLVVASMEGLGLLSSRAANP